MTSSFLCWTSCQLVSALFGSFRWALQRKFQSNGTGYFFASFYVNECRRYSGSRSCDVRSWQRGTTVFVSTGTESWTVLIHIPYTLQLFSFRLTPHNSSQTKISFCLLKLLKIVRINKNKERKKKKRQNGHWQPSWMSEIILLLALFYPYLWWTGKKCRKCLDMAYNPKGEGWRWYFQNNLYL